MKTIKSLLSVSSATDCRQQQQQQQRTPRHRHPPLPSVQESEAARRSVSECDDLREQRRRDEEHNSTSLVAACQVLGTCVAAAADTPRSTFHVALTNTLTAATQGCGQAKLWSGSLPSAASEELNQVAHVAGLNWEVEQLVWWVVGSQLTLVDASWTLSQLHRVQAALAAGVYTEEETTELLHSLTLYIHCQLKRLRTLHTTFPINLATTQHQSQLTYTLRTLGSVERHSCTRALLDQVGQPPIEEDVAAALLRHAQDWWGEVLSTCGWRAAAAGESSRVRVEDAASLLDSIPSTLRELNQCYHHVFLTELKIPYASLSHRELCRHLAHLTKTLLDSTPTRSGRGVRCQGRSECPVLENFGIGSPLWCVYKSLGKIYSMGEECSRSSSESCHPSDYPGCFLASVGTWLTHTHTHILHRLHHPPPSPQVSHSASQNSPLHELLRAYREAGRWWQELSWPEEETAGVVVVLLLQHLTSLTSTLCHSLAPHNGPTSTPSHSPPTPSSHSTSTFYQALHPHPTSSSTVLPSHSTSSSTSNSSSTFYHSLDPSSASTPSLLSSSDNTSEDSSEGEETRTKIPPLRQTSSAYFDTKVYRCLDTVCGAREAVGQLSTGVVGVNEVLTKLRDSGRNGAADQLETTVTALLTSVIQNLDSLAHQVIFTAVDEVRERLQVEVEAACEGGEDNIPPLLYLSLHNTVINLQRQLSVSPSPDIASALSSSSSSSSSSGLQNVLLKQPLFSKTAPVVLSGSQNMLSTTSVSSKLAQMSLSQSQNLSAVSSSKVVSAPFSSRLTPFSSSRSLVYLSPSSSQNLPSPSCAPDILLSSGSRFPSPSVFSSSRPSMVCSSPLLVSSSSFASSAPVCPQQRLLQQLWDALVVQFMVLVADSIGKRSSEYFSGVVAVLESVFSLLTSPGRLHPAAASTPGYQSVVEQARQQRVSTIELISRYYHERYSQQINGTIPVTAQVLVRAYCRQPGHLTVRVLGARNVSPPRPPGAQGRRGSSRGTPKYHVQVELVPSEVFPGASLCRTSSSSHSPPQFDDTFEFPTGVCEGEGFLHVSLVTGGGTVAAAAMVVVGEAFLPLPLIPYLDSPSLQNTSLAITRPAFPPGYAVVSALRTRVWDSRACSFVRQLERRYPEAKPQPHPTPAIPNTYSHS